jgi:hypothetical protein
MRSLIAAAVCLGVLYAVDVHWFGGIAIKSMIMQIGQTIELGACAKSKRQYVLPNLTRLTHRHVIQA